MNMTRVVRLRPGAAPRKQTRAAPHRKTPPSHLHAAAKHAWADIETSRPSLPDADGAMLERAAVLLAQFRDFGMARSLV